MKKMFLLLIPLIIGGPVCGQKKLKTTVVEESGDTLWSTADQRIYTKPGGPRAVGDYLKTTLYKSKAGYSLGFEIQTGRTNAFTISKGSEVEIELTNNETVTLYCNNASSSRVSRLDYGCYIFVFYRVPPAEFKQLLSSPVKLIRVHASIGTMDFGIKEKASGTLQEQLERISRGD